MWTVTQIATKYRSSYSVSLLFISERNVALQTCREVLFYRRGSHSRTAIKQNKFFYSCFGLFYCTCASVLTGLRSTAQSGCWQIRVVCHSLFRRIEERLCSLPNQIKTDAL